MNNCVAINIISHNNIINNKGIPIMFYWDGLSDIKTELLRHGKFKDFLLNTVINTTNYTTTKIAYFFFTEDYNNGMSEVYNDDVIDLQTLFPLSLLDDKIVFDYVYSLSLMLYEKAFNTKYNVNEDNKNTVITIYKLIKNKYKDKLDKATYIEWFRSELIKLDNKLTNDNLTHIINVLNKNLI